MNLYRKAQIIALEAWEESESDLDIAQELIVQAAESTEEAIYYHKGIQFCCDNNTNEGEQWIEDIYGNIAREGDSFGQIACRIAFATIYCAAMDCLHEIEKESEE